MGSIGSLGTLHDLAVCYAETQANIVDGLTEDTPILEVVKWKPTNKGLENVVPVLTEIEGPAFVDMEGSLPFVTASRDLRVFNVIKWGATDEVTKDAAMKLGGAAKYFSDNFNPIMRKASVDLEKKLIYNYWLRAATYCNNKLNKRTLVDAGDPNGGHFLMAIHFDEQYNVGLYDPQQYSAGNFFTITYPYGGKLHILHGAGKEQIYGFSILYECLIGYQIVEDMADRCIAAIVNIDIDNDKHLPTETMVDDLLDQVRAQPKNTYLFCTPRVVSHCLKGFKKDRVQMSSSETDIKTQVLSWDGIPIIPSYNLTEKLKHIHVEAV